jgi:hypothetical protein
MDFFPTAERGVYGVSLPFYLGVMKFDSNPDKNPDLFTAF